MLTKIKLFCLSAFRLPAAHMSTCVTTAVSWWVTSWCMCWCLCTARDLMHVTNQGSYIGQQSHRDDTQRWHLPHCFVHCCTTLVELGQERFETARWGHAWVAWLFATKGVLSMCMSAFLWADVEFGSGYVVGSCRLLPWKIRARQSRGGGAYVCWLSCVALIKEQNQPGMGGQSNRS